MASNHALSYAFWTSRKITYAVFPFFLVSWIVCFSVMRWSQVALPGVPPACDPVITTCFLAATKQLYEWFSPSVCLSVRLSVCPSVCHTFLTMFPSSYHHEIFGSYYQWQKWRPCKRSRSEVKGQGHRGHNPTYPFPDCNSSLNSHMMMKWCI